MSQENLQTMIMQNFGGVKEVYYGIEQVVNGAEPIWCGAKQFAVFSILGNFRLE